MATEFPPVDWPLTPPAVTSDDAQKLATAISSVAEVVGQLKGEMAAIRAGGSKPGPLSQVEWVAVNCMCGRQLLSTAGADYDRMDWSVLGKGMIEHAAGHLLDGRGYYIQFNIQITAKSR